MPTTFTGSEACVMRRSIFRRAEMGFLDMFSGRLRGRRNDRDEGSEREDSVYSCEQPGKDQGGILEDDDFDVNGESVDEEEG